MVISRSASWPVDDHPGGAPHQRARRLDLGLHVGEHVGDRLEGADRPAELLAVLGVLHGEIDDGLRRAAHCRRPR